MCRVYPSGLTDCLLCLDRQGEPGADNTTPGAKGDPGNPGLPVRTLTHWTCFAVSGDVGSFQLMLDLKVCRRWINLTQFTLGSVLVPLCWILFCHSYWSLCLTVMCLNPQGAPGPEGRPGESGIVGNPVRSFILSPLCAVMIPLCLKLL